MVESGIEVNETMENRGTGISLCCPKCKSHDIEIKESREGYFWVYLCHNCGYKGQEGDKMDCIKKEDSILEIESDEYSSSLDK